MYLSELGNSARRMHWSYFVSYNWLSWLLLHSVMVCSYNAFRVVGGMAFHSLFEISLQSDTAKSKLFLDLGMIKAL